MRICEFFKCFWRAQLYNNGYVNKFNTKSYILLYRTLCIKKYGIWNYSKPSSPLVVIRLLPPPPPPYFQNIIDLPLMYLFTRKMRINGLYPKNVCLYVYSYFVRKKRCCNFLHKDILYPSKVMQLTDNLLHSLMALHGKTAISECNFEFIHFNLARSTIVVTFLDLLVTPT